MAAGHSDSLLSSACPAALACLVIHAVVKLAGVAHLFISFLIYDPDGLISTTLPFDFCLFHLSCHWLLAARVSFVFLLSFPSVVWSSYTDSLPLVVLLKDLPGASHPQTRLWPEQLTALTAPCSAGRALGQRSGVCREGLNSPCRRCCSSSGVFPVAAVTDQRTWGRKTAPGSVTGLKVRVERGPMGGNRGGQGSFLPGLRGESVSASSSLWRPLLRRWRGLFPCLCPPPASILEAPGAPSGPPLSQDALPCQHGHWVTLLDAGSRVCSLRAAAPPSTPGWRHAAAIATATLATQS